MKGHRIVPIADVGARPPEAGRIRLGRKGKTSGGKVKPMAIDTFRFTSPNRAVLEAVASAFGGMVAPWNDPSANPPTQFEVLSPAKVIPIYLYPEGFSAWYELWSKGGCLRRCDGVTVQVPVEDGDDYTLEDRPCICERDRVQLCSVKVRLGVILPNIPFSGIWRVETGSHNAHAEMTSMVNIIEAVEAQGSFVPAELAIEPRKVVVAGRTKNFVVPVVRLTHTIEQLAALSGGPALAIGAPSVATPALTTSAAGPEPLSLDAADQSLPPIDDIVDAEVVDDATLAIERQLAEDATNFGLDSMRYINAIRRQIGVTDTNPFEEQRARMLNASTLVRAGRLIPLGFITIDSIEAIDWQRGGEAT